MDKTYSHIEISSRTFFKLPLKWDNSFFNSTNSEQLCVLSAGILSIDLSKLLLCNWQQCNIYQTMYISLLLLVFVLFSGIPQSQAMSHKRKHTHTTVLWPFFLNYPGKPVPEENFCRTFMMQGKKTETDTPTIRLHATPSRLISDPPQNRTFGIIGGFHRPDALHVTQPTASKHWHHPGKTSELLELLEPPTDSCGAFTMAL